MQQKEKKKKKRSEVSVSSKSHLLECQGGGTKGGRAMLSLLPGQSFLLAEEAGEGRTTFLKRQFCQVAWSWFMRWKACVWPMVCCCSPQVTTSLSGSSL